MHLKKSAGKNTFLKKLFQLYNAVNTEAKRFLKNFNLKYVFKSVDCHLQKKKSYARS